MIAQMERALDPLLHTVKGGWNYLPRRHEENDELKKPLHLRGETYYSARRLARRSTNQGLKTLVVESFVRAGVPCGSARGCDRASIPSGATGFLINNSEDPKVMMNLKTFAPSR